LPGTGSPWVGDVDSREPACQLLGLLAANFGLQTLRQPVTHGLDEGALGSALAHTADEEALDVVVGGLHDVRVGEQVAVLGDEEPATDQVDGVAPVVAIAAHGEPGTWIVGDELDGGTLQGVLVGRQ
jgi:hypothetical protein